MGQVNEASRAIADSWASMRYGCLPRATRSRLMSRMSSLPSGSAELGVASGSAARTPVAAYRALTPYAELTDRPSTALIRYQEEPDLAVGHTADQAAPAMVPDTVTDAPRGSDALTDPDSDGAARRFAPAQAGVMAPADAEACVHAATGTSRQAETNATPRRMVEM